MRRGALNLNAAFDPYSGRVYEQYHKRKRQQECIAFLEYVDRKIAEFIRTFHLMCDHVRTDHGGDITKWLAKLSRFIVHFTPQHCS
jgi:hypothetical protein